MKDCSQLEKDEIGIIVCVMARDKGTPDDFKPCYIGTISLSPDENHKDKPHWYLWQRLVNATLFNDPEEFFKLAKEIHDDIEKYEINLEIDWSGAFSFYSVSAKHLVTFNEIKWDW